MGSIKSGAAVFDGLNAAMARHSLKSEQSLVDAATSDPLAFQVGSDLGAKLADGQITSLPDVEACEANAACTIGMVTGATGDAGKALPLGQYAAPVGGMTALSKLLKPNP